MGNTNRIINTGMKFNKIKNLNKDIPNIPELTDFLSKNEKFQKKSLKLNKFIHNNYKSVLDIVHKSAFPEAKVNKENNNIKGFLDNKKK